MTLAQMRSMGDPALAFWLTRSVARSLGVSLTEAMLVGTLSKTEYAAMVTRCRLCPRAEECTAWLATPRGPACSAPEGCANAELLERLARD